MSGFSSIHSDCLNGNHASVQAVSERLELWGYLPGEAYRIASLRHEGVESA